MFDNIKSFFNRLGNTKKETIRDEYRKDKDLNALGVLGIAVDKETEIFLTPQTLMFLAYMMLEIHPELASSYIQYTNFFIGKGLRSKNKLVDDKIKANKVKINNEFKKSVYNYLSVGNVYIQKFYDKTAEYDRVAKTTIQSDNTKLKAFSVIRDSSRVYYNFDAQEDKEYWYYSVHYTAGAAIEDTPAYYTFVKYAIQQISNMLETKYITPLSKNEIVHLRTPYGRNEYYGYSTLMSGWCYGRALKEIIDNLFRIAKYQAIGKKMVFPAADEKKIVTDTEMQEIENKFYAEEKQMIFINKKIQMIPISYQGEYHTMKEEMEYLRRSLMSGSIPTFLTAFAGEDFNSRSLGDDSLIGFFMNLESDREMILSFWEELFAELWGLQKEDIQLYLENAKGYNPEDDVENGITNNEESHKTKNKKRERK